MNISEKTNCKQSLIRYENVKLTECEWVCHCLCGTHTHTRICQRLHCMCHLAEQMLVARICVMYELFQIRANCVFINKLLIVYSPKYDLYYFACSKCSYIDRKYFAFFFRLRRFHDHTSASRRTMIFVIKLECFTYVVVSPLSISPIKFFFFGIIAYIFLCTQMEGV